MRPGTRIRTKDVLRPAVQIGYPGEKPKLSFPSGSLGAVVGVGSRGSLRVTMDACPLAVYEVYPSDIVEDRIEAKVILDKEDKTLSAFESAALSFETYRRLGFLAGSRK